MRKIASAILILVFAFNLFGYRVVVGYMQHRGDVLLEANLDKDLYDESQLIELKVPIHLPYQTSWAKYERYDGEIEINGNLYKYVERKVANDTLYLKCLPNTQRMHLESTKDDFFKNTNDFAQQNNSKNSGNSKTAVFKKAISDYDQHSLAVFLAFSNSSTCSFRPHPEPGLLSSPHISPEQPPDFSC